MSLANPSFGNPKIPVERQASSVLPFPEKTVHIIDAEHTLKIGDHVVVPFSVPVQEVAFHHGIWLGRRNGQLCVLDFTVTSGIAERGFAEFMNSEREVMVADHGPEENGDTMERVAMALRGEYPRGYKYDVVDNNCEHLANWCKTGSCVSKQTDNLSGLLRVLAKYGLGFQASLGKLSQKSASSFASMGKQGFYWAPLIAQLKENFELCEGMVPNKIHD